MNLVRTELFKLRTTSIWWVMLIILIPLYAASLLLNWATYHGGGPDRNAAEVAADLYTSGQFMGVLIVLLLSAIMVTSEFFHLTATSTFLITPKRQSVILAKYAAAVLVGLAAWALTTVLNLIFVPLILGELGFGAHLGDSAVWQSVGLNALAFVLWSVLGVGAGVVIRSQIATTLVLAVLYVVGSSALSLIFVALSTYVAEWFKYLVVVVPTIASQVMVSGGTDLPGSPARWEGALIMVAYAVVMGIVGTLITTRRDVS